MLSLTATIYRNSRCWFFFPDVNRRQFVDQIAHPGKDSHSFQVIIPENNLIFTLM
jgi:hypothetical protein